MELYAIYGSFILFFFYRLHHLVSILQQAKHRLWRPSAMQCTSSGISRKSLKFLSRPFYFFKWRYKHLLLRAVLRIRDSTMKYLANNGYYRMLTVIFQTQEKTMEQDVRHTWFQECFYVDTLTQFSNFEPVCFLNDF